jgi:hypothetical protein
MKLFKPKRKIETLVFNFPFNLLSSKPIEVRENGIITFTDFYHRESRFVKLEEPKFPGDDRTRIYSDDMIWYKFQVQNKNQLIIIEEINKTSKTPSFSISYFIGDDVKKIVKIENLSYDMEEWC